MACDAGAHVFGRVRLLDKSGQMGFVIAPVPFVLTEFLFLITSFLMRDLALFRAKSTGRLTGFESRCPRQFVRLFFQSGRIGQAGLEWKRPRRWARNLTG